MTSTLQFPSSGIMPLWRDANAVDYYAREVASEVPSRPADTLSFITNAASTATRSILLINRFQRLVTRQGRLLSCLQGADLEGWGRDDCGQMALLLEDLLHDNGEILANAALCPTMMRMLWTQSMKDLRSQTEGLEAICFRLDALSVIEKTLPGDEGYRELLSKFGPNDDFDCSLDRDQRKVHSVSR
jgi:hypothetical protein